ncbi:MAG: hypothetical protein WA828_19730, partial [Coleofasciculaceae cyanobacterium]
ALGSWNSGGWFAALFATGHLCVGIGLIWKILFTLLGKVRLRITQSEISLSSEIFGLKWRTTAHRENIVRVELTRLSHKKGYKGNMTTVPPQVNIWAGTKKFALGSGYSLTPPELEWLTQNLSSWLNLPITKE